MKTLKTLGCVGCPCSSSCASRPATLSGLGCQCLGCPNAATCTKHKGMNGLLGDFSLDSIDFTDWKTWLIGGLLVALLYNMFFRQDQRQARQTRRKALSTARDRYSSEVSRIRSAA
jgi:hypothetical protein